MELTEAQFQKIEHCFPRQRGNVSMSNLQVLNAILCVAEHGANGVVCQSALADGTRSIRA